MVAEPDSGEAQGDGLELSEQTPETKATADARSIGGAIGAIAHVAYHLGAIQQKVAVRDEA